MDIRKWVQAMDIKKRVQAVDKKIWILIGSGAALIALIILLALIPGSPSAPANSTIEPQLVGICYRDKNTEENTTERATLEAYLKDKGLQVMAVDADGDQAKQLEQIQKLTQQGCDSLILEPVITDAIDTLLKAIDDSGLPALLFHRELDPALIKSHPKIAYVGTDSSQPGKLQAELALNLPNNGDINGDGVLSYLLLKGPEKHIQTAAYEAALDAALSAGSVETQCLAAFYSDGTRENGKLIATQEIAKYGKDIEVIFCGNDDIALGTIEAIEDGGRSVGRDIYLYGIGGNAEARVAIQKGNMTGTVYTDSLAYRSAVYNTAVAQIKKQAVTQIQIIPYTTITSDSAAKKEK